MSWMSPRVREIALCLLGFSSLLLNVICNVKMFAAEPHIHKTPTYSVHPSFWYTALAAQTALQLRWLWRYYCTSKQPSVELDVESASQPRNPQKKSDQRPTAVSETRPPMSYILVYTFGNLCIAMWAAAYQSLQYSLGQILLLTNVAAQIYALIFVLGDNSNEIDRLTLVVAKVFLGTTIMHLWHTRGMINVPVDPTGMQKLQTESIFLLLTIGSGPDPTLGLMLVYTLIGLFLGQHQTSGWHPFFLYSAASIATTVLIDNVCTSSNKGFLARLPSQRARTVDALNETAAISQKQGK